MQLQTQCLYRVAPPLPPSTFDFFSTFYYKIDNSISASCDAEPSSSRVKKFQSLLLLLLLLFLELVEVLVLGPLS